MKEEREVLLAHLEELHTTEMGVDRIKRNLGLTCADVVSWCKKQILKEERVITREGKNWYVEVDGVRITVNAYSYTIITAHRIK